MTPKRDTRHHTLAVQVIPPPRASHRDIQALETAAQSLALDSRHPVALEIARTPQGREFLLRATSRVALEHLADQIQARYPQASMLPVACDPLTRAADERISAVELRPGAASYLPLRTWRDRELQGEGADPLLGLLAALSHIPENMRAVAQLAIVPVKPTWSQPHRRMTVEHPLEPERQRQYQRQTRSSSPGPSSSAIVGMGALVAYLVAERYWKSKIPPWIIHAVIRLLHGTNPDLTATQLTLVSSVGVIALILLVLLKLVLTRRKTTIYDMRLVAEKTGKSAYRARLRLFVIESPDAQTVPVVSSKRPLLTAFHALRHVGVIQACKQWCKCQRQKTRASHERQAVLDQLIAAYRQYHTAAGGYFVKRPLSAHKARRLLVQKEGWVGRRVSGWASDLWRSRHILSVADVGMLFHLPQSSDLADLPLLERGRARTFLAPHTLTNCHGWRIGVSTHAGHVVPVSLPLVELRRNFLALASTGKGKSTLFQHVAQALLSTHPGDEPFPVEMDGLFVLEPHRDMIEAILGLVPASRRENVILVDLANRDYPVGLNPIDATLGRDRDKAVDNLLVIFSKIWEMSWGPRTENVMEYSLKTLADANETIVGHDPQNGPDAQYTLLDVITLLRQQSFRHTVMDQVADSVLKTWWQRYYEPMDLRFQLEVISSVVTKLSKFASSRVSRRILGQPRSTLNLSQMVQQGQILLISTAAGIVGSDLSTLIGSFLLGLFHMTLAEQAELHRGQRRHCLALIDEFQVFQGVDWNSMLAELRKVGGSFGLATQSLAYLDKMDKTLRATVMANIDHLFAFAMAAEDARLLRELEGVEVEDVTTLDNYMCYVRASLGTRRLPVFSLTIDPPAAPDEQGAQWIRRRSQQRDARPAATVDEMLAAAFRRSTSPGASSQDTTDEKLGAAPAGQKDQEPKATHGPRGKRRSSKAKTVPPAELEAAPTSNARQEPPQEEGQSRPLLYEGVRPGAWGREEHDHEP